MAQIFNVNDIGEGMNHIQQYFYLELAITNLGDYQDLVVYRLAAFL